MIISNDNAESRLNNPMNLINRMAESRNRDKKQNSAMSLFGVRRFNHNENKQEDKIVEQKEDNTSLAAVGVPFVNPFQKTATLLPDTHQILQTETLDTPSISVAAPKVDDLLENSDNKIKLATAHNNALDLLNNAVTQLNDRLLHVSEGKLPGVITAASKVVESIRRERVEIMKTGKDKEVHYHFYTPTQKSVETYEVIDV